MVKLYSSEPYRISYMNEIPGSVGTSASFILRLGQTLFSSASLLFMSLGVEFYSYTAFWYLFSFCYSLCYDDNLNLCSTDNLD